MSPRLRYRTLEIGPIDIHVCTLWDVQEYEDVRDRAARFGIGSATWSTFGVIWASGKRLARLMATYEVGERRVLEVGCGIGLASLVLNKRGFDITATDHHPEAGTFLQRNAALNETPPIPFVRSGWEERPNLGGPFDLVIASDVLYERGHAEALSGFIEAQGAPTSEIIIVDPRRRQNGRFTALLGALGYAHRELDTQDGDELGERVMIHTRTA